MVWAGGAGWAQTEPFQSRFFAAHKGCRKDAERLVTEPWGQAERPYHVVLGGREVVVVKPPLSPNVDGRGVLLVVKDGILLAPRKGILPRAWEEQREDFHQHRRRLLQNSRSQRGLLGSLPASLGRARRKTRTRGSAGQLMEGEGL